MKNKGLKSCRGCHCVCDNSLKRELWWGLLTSFGATDLTMCLSRIVTKKKKPQNCTMGHLGVMETPFESMYAKGATGMQLSGQGAQLHTSSLLPSRTQSPFLSWLKGTQSRHNLLPGICPDGLLLPAGFMCAVTQWCPTLCNPVDCSPSGSSVHGDSPGKNT